ncbi:hypothetical protein CEXT_82761 [Caerostris extrusa]|uniref:Uncharacterized protein n=1 Tax=Caerostris extrusa TaxID=172846 RepID=A0AAV4XGK2_CAEEX|nr:hypothetical protein CEXT_82761 [Caerostris extrusa]
MCSRLPEPTRQRGSDFNETSKEDICSIENGICICNYRLFPSLKSCDADVEQREIECNSSPLKYRRRLIHIQSGNLSRHPQPDNPNSSTRHQQPHLHLHSTPPLQVRKVMCSRLPEPTR